MSTYFNGDNSSTYSSYYSAGGSVTIGAGVAIVGDLFGVDITGEGTIVNLGTVESDTYGYSTGIELGSGTITNGSAADRTALVRGDTGIKLGGGGVINNFGTILAKTGIFSEGGITIYNSGTIDNGAHHSRTGTGIAFGYSNEYGNASELIVNDRNADISGWRSIYGGTATVGTIINYGTIGYHHEYSRYAIKRNCSRLRAPSRFSV